LLVFDKRREVPKRREDYARFYSDKNEVRFLGRFRIVRSGRDANVVLQCGTRFCVWFPGDDFSGRAKSCPDQAPDDGTSEFSRADET